MTGRTLLCLWLATATPALAAVPTSQTALTVSVTVLPRCNDSACPAIPRMVSFGPAGGGLGQPAFGLPPADGQVMMTVTF